MVSVFSVSAATTNAFIVVFLFVASSAIERLPVDTSANNTFGAIAETA